VPRYAEEKTRALSVYWSPASCAATELWNAIGGFKAITVINFVGPLFVTFMCSTLGVALHFVLKAQRHAHEQVSDIVSDITLDSVTGSVTGSVEKIGAISRKTVGKSIAKAKSVSHGLVLSRTNSFSATKPNAKLYL
jgi:hypothetical protein